LEAAPAVAQVGIGVSFGAAALLALDTTTMTAATAS